MTSDDDLDAMMGELSWDAWWVVLVPDRVSTESGRAEAKRAGLADGFAGRSRTPLGNAIVARLREIAAGLTAAERIVLGTPAYRFSCTPRGSSVSDAKALVRRRMLEPMEWRDADTGVIVLGFRLTPLGRAVAAVIGEVRDPDECELCGIATAPGHRHCGACDERCRFEAERGRDA